MKLPTFCQRPIAPLELQLQLPRFLHTAWAITNDPLVVSKLSLAAVRLPSGVVGVRSLFPQCPRYVIRSVLVLVLALVAGCS